jgi:hypothetical protein
MLRQDSFGNLKQLKSEGPVAIVEDVHTNHVASPKRLSATSIGEKMRKEGNLALPITFIRDDLVEQKKKLRRTFAEMLRQDSFGNLQKLKPGPVVRAGWRLQDQRIDRAARSA